MAPFQHINYDANKLLHVVCQFNLPQVLMGLYTPDDGHVDPYSVTQAMAIGARSYGATIYQGAPVTAMRPAADGGWEVDTPLGGVKARRVINAGGK